MVLRDRWKPICHCSKIGQATAAPKVFLGMGLFGQKNAGANGRERFIGAYRGPVFESKISITGSDERSLHLKVSQHMIEDIRKERLFTLPEVNICCTWNNSWWAPTGKDSSSSKHHSFRGKLAVSFRDAFQRFCWVALLDFAWRKIYKRVNTHGGCAMMCVCVFVIFQRQRFLLYRFVLFLQESTFLARHVRIFRNSF